MRTSFYFFPFNRLLYCEMCFSVRDYIIDDLSKVNCVFSKRPRSPLGIDDLYFFDSLSFRRKHYRIWKNRRENTPDVLTERENLSPVISELLVRLFDNFARWKDAGYTQMTMIAVMMFAMMIMAVDGNAEELARPTFAGHCRDLVVIDDGQDDCAMVIEGEL